MKYVNITPHTINLVCEDGKEVVIAPSGIVARVSEFFVRQSYDIVPLVSSEFGTVFDLPDPEDGVMYITSRIVMGAAPDRTDLCAPGSLLRDGEGKIVGCTNLIVRG